jgi:ubiquinone/menaquinone biosynthesis C-methylase UbiE
MIRLVAGLAKPAPLQIYERFFKSGLRDANVVREVIARTGHAMEEFGSILDHGCGCGRVIRHWKQLEGPSLAGSDYNPYLIEWCQANLPFATFKANSLEARLDYEDEAFDLVYAISVFTHLDRELQAPWIAELRRVMQPGGLLLMTIFSSRSEEHLDPAQREQFVSGDLVVSRPMLRGTNACTAFHPERYVTDELASGLEILEWAPGAKDGRQDAVVLQKPRT